MLRQLFATSVVLILSATLPVLRADDQKTCPPGKIVGGRDADIKDHSWQVALRVPILATGGLSGCGGSIIAAKWILTAAHCFDQFENRDHSTKEGADWREIGSNGVTIMAGKTKKSEGDWKSVGAIFLHKSYKADGVDDDIALIRLAEPIAGQNVAAIEVAQSTLKLIDNACLEVTGWGFTKPEVEEFSNVLQMAEIPYLSKNDGACGKPGLMCAGKFRVDSCRGDSGGPLVLRRDPSPAVLVGIVSNGPQAVCGGKSYGVYTRVATYHDWIAAAIKANP